MENPYESYKSFDIFLDCEFCWSGPLECECSDVDMSDVEEITIESALADTDKMFSAVTKLGRAQTEALLDELALDRNDSAAWVSIDSMAMWA